MLPKDLLRVSRAGGGYRPVFADAADEDLAARVVGVFQGHVGRERSALRSALTDLEREAEDHRLVRGFAHLLERDATFETRAAVDPRRARRAALAAAESVGVVTEAEREAALARAAAEVDATAAAVAASLYADRESRQVLTAVDPRWSPAGLLAQYNLSLAQTALFDATSMRVRTADPRGLITAVKRLGLLYEIRREDGEQVVELTGPDALFRRTRRYGTRLARVLRSVVAAESWSVEATVDDRGTERTLRLSDADPLRRPDADPVTDAGDAYDSGVERDFAGRVGALDLDWTLVREPDLLAAGDRVMVPDFAFDYDHGEVRVYLEIMGFWTPAYVEKKLSQLDAVEGVELLVAYDESLGVGEDIEASDHRAVPYTDRVPIKPVRDALRRYERDLVAAAAASLPDELVPDADVTTLAEVAAARGVSEDALAGVAFPDHERVGRTLVRPAVLESVAARLDCGMALAEAESVLDEYGVDDASAALSRVGYRVAWEGLGGGTLRRRETGDGSTG